MIYYQDFFNPDSIIRYLCNKRMAYSRKAHTREFFARLSPYAKKQLSDDSILNYMPPRSRWIRASKRNRLLVHSCDQNGRDLFSTVKLLRERNRPADHDWITAQNNLITQVQTRAFSPYDISFANPELRTIRKKNHGNEYRIIANYEVLEDAIILGQCANYLRSTFENLFYDCSFAFRKECPTPTHHDAFKKLASFWNRYQQSGSIEAYAAECDIQGFYDTVNHQIILNRYNRAIDKLAQKGIYVDAGALFIIKAYLESYSYNKYAYPQVKKSLEKSVPGAFVKNRDETLDGIYKGTDFGIYGIPQGGALSVFFANLLLHWADEAIVSQWQNQVTYLRYCDDIVIVGLDEEIVDEALHKYIQALTELRLVYHTPVEFQTYSKEFWSGKSKLTYRWGRKSVDGTSVPWLAFVGYHLRYDGLVRVRPSSIYKELEKQADITSRFLKRVIPTLKQGQSKRSVNELLSSLEARLRAGAIGRRSEWDFDIGDDLAYCWCAGFCSLGSSLLPKSQPILQTQLRQLDRGLGHQLSRAKHALKQYRDVEQDVKLVSQRRRSKFLGKPRSYSGQF